MMRRLDADHDEQLIREAVAWIDDEPLFYRNCNDAWAWGEDADTYLELMRSEPQADFGVFDGEELRAVITITLEGKGVFNSHLMVKRGTNPELVAVAAMNVIKGLLENGLKEGWSWIARKNLGARKILEAVGMRRDGLTMIKGQSHGQPIHWVRYSVRAT